MYINIAGKKLTKSYRKTQQLNRSTLPVLAYILQAYTYRPQEIFYSHSTYEKISMEPKIFSQINSVSNIINLYSFQEENILTNFPQSGSNSFQFYLKCSVVSPTLHTTLCCFSLLFFLVSPEAEHFSYSMKISCKLVNLKDYMVR